MESGNSGSLPSSSGGDDEYESQTFSPFFNSSQQTHAPPPMFNPIPNYIDPNLEMIWSKSLRSDQNQNQNPLQFFTPPTTIPFSPVRENIAPPHPPPPEHNHNHTNNNLGVAIRNPKKRSRASRRAPTTVLTTDTTNFRAMVQEFTGIPAPPFASSTFNNRARFDLFGAQNNRSNNPLDHTSQQSYLLRPFAQKPQSFGIGSSSTNNNMQNLNQYQNPILTFQSLLHSTQKYPSQDPSILGSCSKGPDEFGVNTSTNGLPNPVASEVTAPRNNNNGYMGSTSSNLEGGKGEGLVESWICSSEL